MVEKYKGIKSYELAVDCLHSGSKNVRDMFDIWVKGASAINLLNGIEYCVQQGYLGRHEIINLIRIILKENEPLEEVFNTIICQVAERCNISVDDAKRRTIKALNKDNVYSELIETVLFEIDYEIQED